MSSRVKTLIIAPHIDDELIGCWSVLNDPLLQVDVFYLEELTDARKVEALDCAERFGFRPLFADEGGQGRGLLAASFGNHEKVYVPSRKDWHAAHKRANAQWRDKATHFYSVDMAEGKLLPDAEAKREALDAIYPSQSDLWKNDQKYWLFEDILAVDYDVYRKLSWRLTNGKDLSITTLEEYSEAVSCWYIYTTQRGALWGSRTQVVNAILALCVRGKVTIEYGDERIEA